MPERKATPPRGQISGARVVPLHIETARQFGGGARGRTLAIIYRQLCYWSKYAKWKGKNGKRFFYKSQRELAEELGYSEKTINRATKPSSLNAPAAPGGAVHPAAAAAAASIKSKGGRGFGQNVRIQQRDKQPLLKQSLQSVVEKCYAMGEYLKNQQGGTVPIS